MIGLVSISMSNATQEFSVFKQLADADPAKSPRVKVVDCAQGGQAMAQWATPDARPWARDMKNKVTTREMPPWYADPQFAPIRRMAAACISTAARRSDLPI